MEQEQVKLIGQNKEKGNGENIEHYMGLKYSILLHQIEDEGEKFWIAEIPELPGCKSHGLTADEAIKSVEEAKRDWILDSLERGESVPTPIDKDRFNGRILVRTSRSLHRSLSLMSEMEKLSLNQLIVTILAKEVGRLEVLNRVEDKLDNVLDRLSRISESNLVELYFPEVLFDQNRTEFKGDLVQSWVDDDVRGIHVGNAAALPVNSFNNYFFQHGRSNLDFLRLNRQYPARGQNSDKVELVIDKGGLR